MDTLTVPEITNIVKKAEKSSNPSELAVKGLHFGRLYFKAGNYDRAVEWILRYTRKFDRDFQAYRLLGECYEKMAIYDTALDSYKQCLQIKPNQYDLVLHVAQLFMVEGPTHNPSKAQIWLDKAAAALPGDPKVFKMKIHLHSVVQGLHHFLCWCDSAQVADYSPLLQYRTVCDFVQVAEMELLTVQQASSKTIQVALLKELKIRPFDVSLLVQYAEFLKSQNQVKEAFLFCKRTSNFNSSFLLEQDCKWLSCMASVYQDYIDSHSFNMDLPELSLTYCLLLDTLAVLVWQCIAERKYPKAFHNFSKLDKCLLSAIEQNLTNDWQPVIEEMKAQFAWIAGTLLIYQAQENTLPWKEACHLASFFYYFSLSTAVVSLSAAWSVRCNQSMPIFPLRLNERSAIRVSQSSHMVWILKKKLGDSTEDISTANAIGRTAHQVLFDSTSDDGSSFFYSIQIKSDVKLVPVSYMWQNDELAALSKDLHMLIWLGLRWLELEESSDFLPWAVQAFPSLKLNALPISSSVSSLNLLDIESFIVGCVFTVKKKLNDRKGMNVNDAMSLTSSTLPVALCRRLTTDLQEKWWKAAAGMTSKTSRMSAAEAAKLKPVLQRGIECLRGVGNHGLDTILVTKLAKYFAAKAYLLLDDEGTVAAWFTYQRKAAAYWTLITSELGRLSEGVVFHRSSRDPLFLSFFDEPSPAEAKAFLSEAYMCRGELAARENKTDDAISFYGKASIPQASFSQAHIYKKLLEKLESEESLESQLDLNRKKELLTKKYRYCLEVTLNRLQQQPDESLHEKTIRLLSSPHVSPPRPLSNKSGNDSVLCPSKQSTPKAKSDSSFVTAPLVEKEAVNNLVDTITTLTSALSSLQLEMEYLREENRLMRQSSPQVQTSAQSHRLSHGFSPAMFHTDEMQGLQSMTPQRYISPNPQMLSCAKEGMPFSPVAARFQNGYQQQAQAFYTPPTVPYASSNYGYPSYTDNGAMLSGGGYGLNQYSNIPNAQPSTYQRTAPEPASVQPVSQPTNLLAAALQSKDEAVLQQKFGSILSDIRAPKPEIQTVRESSGGISSLKPPPHPFTTPAITPQNVASKSPVLQQLLGGDVSTTTTPVPTKEIKSNLEVNLPPQVIPTSSALEVHFLEGFVSPKSPGTNMKFQSPEQMDRENQELEALEQAYADTSTNADAGPHFEPIIPLPDLVEVKTGEEDEIVLFSERCKLFRWHTDQWKERGIGDMKLLKHTLTGKPRLVMRREQVLKVCCNHSITSSTHLSPMSSCERAMVWIACDFADDEAKTEQFAAKFKTIEIAEQFQEEVNKEAANVGKETPKEKKSDSAIDAAAATFSFGFPATPTTKKPELDKQEEAKPSPFSNLANAMSSAGFAGSGPNGGIKPPLSRFSFGPPKPKAKESSVEIKTVTTPDDEADTSQKEQSSRVEDEDGPQYEPIIDLPDLVELKTGEEDEEVTFCHRAKIFRYVKPEWKERGIGDMKILKHLQTGKYRVVMRREQVMKLCANHRIISGMKLNPQGTSEKSWSWTALDYAEDPAHPQQELLAVKFKTVEEAKKFYQKFKEGAIAADESRSAAATSFSTISPKSPSQAAKAFLIKELKDNSNAWSPKPRPTQVANMEAAPGEPASVASSSAPSQRSDPGRGETTSSKSIGFSLPSRPAGSWTCPECYVSNTAEHAKCPCCDFSNPNASEVKKDSTTTVQSGFNLPPKPAGAWTCSDCYASNSVEHSKCPCCECPNPNIPKQESKPESKPKEEKFIMTFGTGITPSTANNSGFTFGVVQSTAGQNPSAISKQHPALQRAGGSKPAFSQFQFGLAGQNATGFASSPAFGDFQTSDKKELHPSGEIRFPHEEDEYDEETDTTETSETYSGTEESEEEETATTHQSPMSRYSAQQPVKTTDPSTTTKPPEASIAEEPSVDKDSAKTTSQVSAPFSFGSGSLASFSELASGSASASSFSFATSAGKYANVWQPDSKPMFSNLQQFTDDEQNQSAAQEQDSYDADNIYIKPIVDLPLKVTLETGEENETTLFSKRSKLYRWDQETTQWKERGIGEMMIKHNSTTDRFRLLMRREQVLKVCANHYITPEMKLEASLGSNQAWTWLAADYAEDEEKIEKLAIKFKTPEIAQQFKEQFEECQLLLRKKSEDKTDKREVTALISNAEKMKSELGFFKDKLSAKLNINLEKTLTDESSTSNLPYDPNIQLTPLVKQHEMSKEKTIEQESKTEVKEDVSEPAKTSTAKTLQLSQFEFKLNTNLNKTKEDDNDVRREAQRNISVCSATSEEADVHFEPLIPLPAKVAVRTGEENEQAVFEERCKVYIFDLEGSQWKERGIGKLRLLQDFDSFKLRLVMRREQVFKVCLNQMIAAETNFVYKENSANKILVWTGTDFSDTEKVDGETFQFAVRFKSSDEAAELLRCIEDGRDAIREKRLLPALTVQEDVSTVSESPADVTDEPSEEQIKSPVKSPVKPAKPLFSFANLDSSFGTKKTPSGAFVFGATPKSFADQKPFSFNPSAITFNLGVTSTPISAPASTPQTCQSDQSVFGQMPGIFSFSSGTNFTSSSSSNVAQAQQPFIAATNNRLPDKSCISGVDEELRHAQSTDKHEPEYSSGDEDQYESSSSSSEEESGEYSSESEDEPETAAEVAAEEDDDVIFVGEIKPTEEEARKAKELLLPPTFYLYERTQNEDCDSEEEDQILAYINRRDNPDSHPSSPEPEHESYNSQEETTEVSEEQGADQSSRIYSPEKDNADPSEEPVAVTSHTYRDADTDEPQQEAGGLFQSFANMSDFTFTAMAASSNANKHAFGSRKDDAFQVSDEKKVLFTDQTEEGSEADTHDPHYEPLLDELPPLVEVKTGEEEEKILYKERCKLYRFDDDSKSWKERGIGDMKILHHPKINSYRVVMRREQVLKLCANHRILKEMALIPNGEKAFNYVAQDKSDDDDAVKLEKFFVRFKTPEIANKFKVVWEEAREATN